MCEEHHHPEGQHGHHHHHHRRHRFGRRGRGFPNREQLVERLTAYRAHLEHELENVHDLLERLGDGPEQTGPPTTGTA
jgi:hypothetical protein